MKRILLIYSLLVFTNVYAQTQKLQLKSAVIKAENKNYLKLHKDAQIISTDINIISYNLIPLKAWWKGLYDFHHKFRIDMANLMKMYDSIRSNQPANSAGNPAKQPVVRQADPNSFDGEAYFKQKYEATDPSIKVYEIYYSINLKDSKGNGYSQDRIKICLYPKDLSEVKSFEK